MTSDTNIYLGVAVAGVANFLSPCVMPLVPPYLVYLYALAALPAIVDPSVDPTVREATRSRIIQASVAFALGFATVFVALGAGATTAGRWLVQHKDGFATVGGAFIALTGALMMLSHSSTLSRSLAVAFVLGLAFAFGWTPCVGPVLQAVLAVASSPETSRAGVPLLLAYAFGLFIPFVGAAALIAAVAVPILQRQHLSARRHRQMELTFGWLLVASGLAFVTGSTTVLGGWLLDSLPALGTLEDAVTPPSLRAAILNLGHPH